ncbi:hypothetical protein BMF94_7035 [Rhodotorula taiwanensis]|uniref:Uncharacterized protein n=1 Tax=Rhodotorula taiwanensis TaxID=741276 RepID=A0A2S5B007_9BASI|nr:hypothetical protein BMF94_7035 [Rhodotorula taiwanensis]
MPSTLPTRSASSKRLLFGGVGDLGGMTTVCLHTERAPDSVRSRGHAACSCVARSVGEVDSGRSWIWFRWSCPALAARLGPAQGIAFFGFGRARCFFRRIAQQSDLV